MKTTHVKQEREKLLETRFHVRREADRQKQHIMETFEQLKKKGKIDNASLKKLGLASEIKEDPHAEETSPLSDIDIVKGRQHREMKLLVEVGQQGQQERDAKIAAAETDDEKAQLI